MANSSSLAMISEAYSAAFLCYFSESARTSSRLQSQLVTGHAISDQNRFHSVQPQHCGTLDSLDKDQYFILRSIKLCNSSVFWQPSFDILIWMGFYETIKLDHIARMICHVDKISLWLSFIITNRSWHDNNSVKKCVFRCLKDFTISFVGQACYCSTRFLWEIH